MKKVLTIVAVACLGMMLCASVSSAAEAKTEYFTLTLPGDWKQPKPTQKANGATAHHCGEHQRQNRRERDDYPRFPPGQGACHPDP